MLTRPVAVTEHPTSLDIWDIALGVFLGMVMFSVASGAVWLGVVLLVLD